jgi:hypothetical protein
MNEREEMNVDVECVVKTVVYTRSSQCHAMQRMKGKEQTIGNSQGVQRGIWIVDLFAKQFQPRPLKQAW